MPCGNRIGAVLAACAALVLWACAPGPAPESPALGTFREIQRDLDVYRITLSWLGLPPPDVEPRLLQRSAQVAAREGARYFYLVNADLEVHSDQFVKRGSPLTPVFRLPEPPLDPAQPAPPRQSATLTIKLFRVGQEPEGYRLYDVELILHRRVTGT